MKEEVILVDRDDRAIGSMEKMEAHEKGALHRAFSVFVLNSNNELLIHQRAAEKYHSPNLWTNTCCSHPRPGESVLDAAHRRLVEEMGFDCALKPAFAFMYHANMPNGLTEYEYDHVVFGRYDGDIAANPDEVQDWEYVPMASVRADIEAHPENYTVWFRKVFERAYNWYLQDVSLTARFRVA